jgi:stage V sporulation protein B
MKSKFITSTIILIIGGFIAKFLGMFTKIVITRIIGVEGISLYMLVLPTFLLFITISQLGFPVAVSKIIAENKRSNKSVIFSIIPIALLLSVFLIVIIFFISPIISKLLHNPSTYYPLLSIGLTLPFISISGIIRGYFFGKERKIPHTVSNIFEQIVRLIMIIMITPILLEKSLIFAVCGIILYNIVSEFTSILILYFFLPKNVSIKKKDLVPDKSIIKDVLNISLPTTGSRLIGSLSYFFEPIILTTVLLSVGYSDSYIVKEYGIITGFAMPLLMIPSFFTQAISSALLPVISKAFASRHIRYINNKLKQAILISLSIGIIVTIVLMIKPEFFMKLIYNTDVGINYLRVMTPFFLIYYVQLPIVTALQAVNRAQDAMINTLMGAIIKIVLLIVLSLFRIGLYALIVAVIFNIMFVTYCDYRKLKKALRKAA